MSFAVAPGLLIALTNVAANLSTIAAGPLVFAEPLPSGRVGIALRLLAFALVVVAAALTPPPAGPGETPRDAPPGPSWVKNT